MCVESKNMNELLQALRPVQAQTPSRSLGGDPERHLQHQRVWLRQRKPKPSITEPRVSERRAQERRFEERRSLERRTEERRQGQRLDDERRLRDRRQLERRQLERRMQERRSGRRFLSERRLRQATATARSMHGSRRNGLIDEYA